MCNNWLYMLCLYGVCQTARCAFTSHFSYTPCARLRIRPAAAIFKQEMRKSLGALQWRTLYNINGCVLARQPDCVTLCTRSFPGAMSTLWVCNMCRMAIQCTTQANRLATILWTMRCPQHKHHTHMRYRASLCRFAS